MAIENDDASCVHTISGFFLYHVTDQHILSGDMNKGQDVMDRLRFHGARTENV